MQQEPHGAVATAIPVTTAFDFPEWKIERYIGSCFGLVVRSMGAIKGIGASFKALRGGEVTQYTELLEDSRRHAIDRLVENTRLMGANGIVAMRFDSSEIGESLDRDRRVRNRSLPRTRAVIAIVVVLVLAIVAFVGWLAIASPRRECHAACFLGADRRGVPRPVVGTRHARLERPGRRITPLRARVVLVAEAAGRRPGNDRNASPQNVLRRRSTRNGTRPLSVVAVVAVSVRVVIHAEEEEQVRRDRPDDVRVALVDQLLDVVERPMVLYRGVRRGAPHTDDLHVPPLGREVVRVGDEVIVAGNAEVRERRRELCVGQRRVERLPRGSIRVRSTVRG